MVWRSEIVGGLTRLLAGVSPQVRLSGWERLSWGMSRQAVERNYPQATSAIEGLVLQPDDPVDRHWKITLGFDQQRNLSQVSLTLAGSQETADFAEISQALTRRLGAPVSSTQTSTTWQRDDTTLTLSRDPEGGLVLSETT